VVKAETTSVAARVPRREKRLVTLRLTHATTTASAAMAMYT
jgi:hypothetical protein